MNLRNRRSTIFHFGNLINLFDLGLSIIKKKNKILFINNISRVTKEWLENFFPFSFNPLPVPPPLHPRPTLSPTGPLLAPTKSSRLVLNFGSASWVRISICLLRFGNHDRPKSFTLFPGVSFVEVSPVMPACVRPWPVFTCVWLFRSVRKAHTQASVKRFVSFSHSIAIRFTYCLSRAIIPRLLINKWKFYYRFLISCLKDKRFKSCFTKRSTLI